MTQRPQATVTAELSVLTEPAEARGISTHLLISILGNIAVFVPLGASAAAALMRTLPPSIRRRWIRAFLGGGLVGTALSSLIELLQLTSTSRFADPADLVLNMVGAFAGSALCLWLVRSLPALRSHIPPTKATETE